MNKKYDVFLHIFLPFILAAGLIAGAFLIGSSYPSNVFHSSYQSIIQDKYDILKSTEGPKIIIVAGSNGAFALDEKLLSSQTGYPVVNMGLHAGFHGVFNTEIAKANIDEGDIVVLAYEYGWYDADYFSDIGVDLVMSGIDSKWEMYQHIPLKNWPEIIGYLPQYLKARGSYIDAGGVYSRDAFDGNASLVMERSFAMSDYDENEAFYGNVDLTDVKVSKESEDYLKAFKDYAENLGARLVFTAPPIYEKAIAADDRDFQSLIEQEEEKIGIPYISNPKDYIYPDEDMFDSIYHCSTSGVHRRTMQLANDINHVMTSKTPSQAAGH